MPAVGAKGGVSIDQARLFFPLLLLIYSQTYISAPKDVANAPASLIRTRGARTGLKV